MQSLFQNPYTNVFVTLSVLRACHIDSEFLDEFVRVVNENKLPNLEELALSGREKCLEETDSDIDTDILILKLQADTLPSLDRSRLILLLI